MVGGKKLFFLKSIFVDNPNLINYNRWEKEAYI